MASVLSFLCFFHGLYSLNKHKKVTTANPCRKQAVYWAVKNPKHSFTSFRHYGYGLLHRRESNEGAVNGAGAIAPSLPTALRPPPGLALASFTWYPNFECKEQPGTTNGAQPVATPCTYIPSSSSHRPESLHPVRSDSTWLSAEVAREGRQLAGRGLTRGEPTQAISLCSLHVPQRLAGAQGLEEQQGGLPGSPATESAPPTSTVLHAVTRTF